jgi:hypothetical protein
MKFALVTLIAGTLVSGFAAAYATTSQKLGSSAVAAARAR